MNKMSKKFKVPMKFINYILNSPFKCSYFKNECEKDNKLVRFNFL